MVTSVAVAQAVVHASSTVVATAVLDLVVGGAGRPDSRQRERENCDDHGDPRITS
jgi:hypothetical protein